MKSIDCFLPLFEYGIELSTSINSSSAPELNDVQSDVENKIQDIERDFIQDKTRDEFDQSLFAIVAWLDELVLASDWVSKNEWAKKLLQKRYFSTSNAGEEFFERLDKLNLDTDPELSIRAVFYHCLTFGFQGKFFEPGDQAKLQEIINSNRDLLQKGMTEQLFPQPLPDKLEYDFLGTTINQLKEYMHIILPILLLIVFFISLRSDVLGVAQTLFREM